MTVLPAPCTWTMETQIESEFEIDAFLKGVRDAIEIFSFNFYSCAVTATATQFCHAIERDESTLKRRTDHVLSKVVRLSPLTNNK